MGGKNPLLAWRAEESHTTTTTTTFRIARLRIETGMLTLPNREQLCPYLDN
jgi:hypothetical protein